MLKSLVYIANVLDEIGSYNKASQIDRCIKKIASNGDTTIVYDPRTHNWEERGADRNPLLEESRRTTAGSLMELIRKILNSIDKEDLKNKLKERWGEDYNTDLDPFFYHLEKAKSSTNRLDESIQNASAFTSLEFHLIDQDTKEDMELSRGEFDTYQRLLEDKLVDMISYRRS